nr:MAG TPA: hypothetical protein [Caudoviricetes sp.]
MWVKSRRKNTEGSHIPVKEKIEGKQFPLQGKLR